MYLLFNLGLVAYFSIRQSYCQCPSSRDDLRARSRLLRIYSEMRRGGRILSSPRHPNGILPVEQGQFGMSAAIRAAANVGVQSRRNYCKFTSTRCHLPFAAHPASARRTEPINCPRITGPPLVYQSVKTFARRKFHCERMARACLRANARDSQSRKLRHRRRRRRRQWFVRDCSSCFGCVFIKDSELMRIRNSTPSFKRGEYASSYYVEFLLSILQVISNILQLGMLVN